MQHGGVSNQFQNESAALAVAHGTSSHTQWKGIFVNLVARSTKLQYGRLPPIVPARSRHLAHVRQTAEQHTANRLKPVIAITTSTP